MVVGLGAIKSYDGTRFEATVKNGKTSARKYYQEYPFLLKIKLDYKRYEAVIEFSGKILGKDYPELISSKTIRQCFENINTIGVCEVDVDAMMDAEVVKCDVTTDRTVTDIPELTGYIRSHIRNYQQYPCRKYNNGNLVIEKNVVSSRTKKRLTIYDKEQEMKRAENSRFVKDNGLQGSYELSPCSLSPLLPCSPVPPPSCRVQVDLVHFERVYLVHRPCLSAQSEPHPVDLVHPLRSDLVHPNAAFLSISSR